ncbi:pantoate--beta-alanine ligase [Paenibacillus sp. CMAA1364]
MIVIRSIQQLRQELAPYKYRNEGKCTIGLVPTMGYLHEGHASLMTRAREMSDVVVVSIFVNPIQFGPGEDYESYPRNEEQDVMIAKQHGVDIVFIPSVNEMYPQATQTKVMVADRTKVLCGASRPGHFDGVTTVVSKLMNIVQPHYAFFGMKDAQQVAVLQQMVLDLNMNVEIVACPIIREQDGLALSSRNVNLTPEERNQSLVISRSLREVFEQLMRSQPLTVSQVREKLMSIINTSPLANIDYVQVLSFPQMTPLEDRDVVVDVETQVILAVAVKFGNTRLIDNSLFMPKEALSLV